MSKSPSEHKVRLEVRAGNPATEIFVSDSSFRRIGKGVDSLDLEVPPGYYKVRYRIGTSQRDELIEVPASDEPVRIEGKPVAYESAAPFAPTSAPVAGDARVAAEISKRVHRGFGAGSRLMVFARDLDRRGPSPGEGLSLLALDGERLADLSDGDQSEDGSCGGLSVELSPGTYRLRVDTSPLGVYEMFLVASPGWQTQVFLLADDFPAGGDRVRRASLRSASVLMARPERGFDPAADDLRLADLARIALRAGRDIASRSDHEAMQYGKFEDPMLGIYAAHLLLLAPRPDHGLIDVIAGNLEGIVGSHADVEVLQLRSGGTGSEEELQLETPPMLKSSWDLLVRASRRRISLVPPGSFNDRIGDNVVSSNPWLLHRVEEREVRREVEDVPFAQGRRLLERLASRGESGEVLERARTLTREGGLSMLEQGLLKAALPMGMAEESESQAESYPGRSSLARQTVSRVIRSVDAPATTIARSAQSLLEKLKLDLGS